MAENILKNEFMWEEEKKKKPLYKNWKLYATVLAILGIGTATGLGIYYGTTNHHEIVKIDLNNLELNKTIIIYNLNDPTASDAKAAFQAFLISNQEKYPDLKDNLEIKAESFIALTDENSTGSLIINAKANTKYTGSLTIIINYQAPTNLNNLNLTTKLPYPVYLNEKSVFDLFIKINSNITDLKDSIEIVKNSYLETDYNKTGSLEVQGKEYSKYIGNATIIINYYC